MRLDEDKKLSLGIDDPTLLALDMDGTMLKRVGESADHMFTGTYTDEMGVLRGRRFLADSFEDAIDYWLDHKEFIAKAGVPTLVKKAASNGSDLPDEGQVSGEVSEPTVAAVQVGPYDGEGLPASPRGAVTVETKAGLVTLTLPDVDPPDASGHEAGQGYSQDVIDYACELWSLNDYPRAHVLAKALERVTNASIPRRTVSRWVDVCLLDLYKGVGGGDIDEFASAIGWDGDYLRKLFSSPHDGDDGMRGAAGSEGASLPAAVRAEGGVGMDGARDQAGGLVENDDASSRSSFDDACMVICQGHEPMLFKTHEGARLYVRHANDVLSVLGHDERLEIAEIEWKD